MPPSKFEANLTLHLRASCISLFSFISISVFVLERLFLCVRDNLIDFLTNRLAFQNTVTYVTLNVKPHCLIKKFDAHEFS